MTNSSRVVDGGAMGAAAETGEKTGAAAPLTPAQRLAKQLEDQHFATLLNTRQALRFTIAELKARPDTLADLEGQLAHVEKVIAESGRPDPELVNIGQQAEDARIRAERSAAAAKEDAERAEELARKAKEKGTAATPAGK